MAAHDITLTGNGTEHEATVDTRPPLVRALRGRPGYTGTNVGFETSTGGAYTVPLDGDAGKPYTVLAARADGTAVRAVEGSPRRCTGYQTVVRAVETAAAGTDGRSAGGDD